MRIYVTGDTHANIDNKKLSTKRWKEQKTLTKHDILIICGDFGVPWTYGESNTDKYMLKWYENKPFTTVFVDGNHENFDMLNTYPVTTFYGAKCHKLRKSIYHVCRGEILNLNGYKIWCFGGAESVDKQYRKEHISWWKEEIPTFEEFVHGLDTIIEEDIDLIITHDAPYSIASKIHKRYVHKTPVNQYLEEIRKKKPDTTWIFGHHHKDTIIDNHYRAIFNDIIQFTS